MNLCAVHVPTVKLLEDKNLSDLAICIGPARVSGEVRCPPIMTDPPPPLTPNAMGIYKNQLSPVKVAKSRIRYVPY